MHAAALHNWSQVEVGERLDSMFTVYKNLGSMEAIKASGDSLMSLGRRTEDCETELLGAAIYVTFNAIPIEELDAILEGINCPVVGYQANNAFATRYYLNQDYPTAMDWFIRAEQAVTSSHEAMACAIAIGACHAGLGNNVEAIRSFNQAYNIADHPAPVMLLNNLAAAQITFGLYDDALELLKGALRVEGWSRCELQLIRLNRLNVFCSIGELEEAQTEYQLLREAFPKRLDATSFKVLLHFASSLNHQNVGLN